MAVWRASKFTFLLSYLIPRVSRVHFRAWYSYLRWVDDCVDEGSKSASERKAFLERQFSLLNRDCHQDALTATPEERRLQRLLESDLGGDLRLFIGRMLESIEFDSAREGRPQPDALMYENHRREACAYLSSVAYFCGLERPAFPIGSDAAVGAKIAHVTRDYIKDARSGQLNVSTEEVTAYGLDRLAAAGVTKWAASNVRLSERLLLHGRAALSECSNFRYKLLVKILIAKYQSYLRSLRAREFVPEAVPRLHLRFFLREMIVCPLGLFLRGHGRSEVTRKFKPIVRLSARRKVEFILRTLPITNRNGLRDLRSTLWAVRDQIHDRARMERRFRGGFLLGYCACRTIAPAFANNAAIRHTAGLIVAYWGLSAIEMDRLQDEKVISSAEILELGYRWLEALRSATDANQPQLLLTTTSGQSDHTFALLSNRFMILVRNFCSVAREEASEIHTRQAQEIFLEKAGFLMRGQMTSMLQTSLGSPKNWSWYYREIMNHKNVEFLLTPFRLNCVEGGSEQRFSDLAATFLSLNATYVHYQLLDDLADAPEDMQQGIIGAAGFVLLSQGYLGQLYNELHPSGIEPFQAQLNPDELNRIDAAIRNSDLLCPEFLNSPLFDRRRHLLAQGCLGAEFGQHLELALRCAISNVESDFSCSLKRLAKRRHQESSMYLAALRDGNVSDARKHLLGSDVPQRILSAVGEEAAVTNLARQLGLITDSSHLTILFTMERMIRKTFRAATEFAQRP